MRELIQAVGMDLLPVQLQGGALGGQMLLLEVPPLRLVRFQLDRRVHSLGTKPQGTLVVSIDLDPRPQCAPWLSHGQELPTDCLFGLCVDRDVHITLPAHISVGMMFVPLGALGRWAAELGWPGFEGELLPRRNVHLMHAASAARLRAFLRRLFALAERSPDRLTRPGCQRRIREDLMPLLLEALVSGPSHPFQAGRPPARIDFVKETERWLHAHPHQPLTLADLCRVAHVSRRTLIQGFHDHLGLGPMAYVKLLRLHGIRHRLLRAEPDEIQIGALADAWGFHNAGHFAAAYRRLFGESPRDTLGRTPRRVF
jgi:AraC family ethanolamine operon transcriptional activator